MERYRQPAWQRVGKQRSDTADKENSFCTWKDQQPFFDQAVRVKN